MKKYILTALIFTFILLVACTDSGSAPFNPGGIFCTEDLAEGEVLTVYAGERHRGTVLLCSCSEN